MPESWKNWENQIVNSRFVLRRFLGSSSHSAVFLTERPGPPPENAAIKLIACDPGTKDFHFSRWHAIAKLSHPNLLKLFHYGHCRLDGQDLLYVVMELADESLAGILPVRPLSPLEARETLIPTVDALSFLHTAGFVHGCIHPANILAAGDQIRLSSDSLCASKDTVTLRPKPGPYTAPEIAAKGFSPAADIYALGVTLVETLTQRAPSPADEPLPGLPIPFDEIAEKALLPDPALRWTAGDIALRLNPGARPNAAAAAVMPKPTKEENPTPVTPGESSARESRASNPVAGAKPQRSASVAPPASISHVSPLPPRRNATPGPAPGYFKPLLAVAVLIVMGAFAYRTLRHDSDAPVKAATARAEHAGSTIPAASSRERTAPRPGASVAPALSESAKSATETARRSVSSAVVSPANGSAVTSAAPATSSRLTAPVETKSPERPKKSTDRAPEPSPAALRSVPERPEPAVSGDSDVLRQVMPDVSQKALNTIRGSVRLAITVQVDSSGKVSSAMLSSPSGSSYFNDAALKAARRWQFQPAADSSAAREYTLRFQFTTHGAQAVASHRPS